MAGEHPHKGRLRDHRLPNLLSFLQRTKKTGVLVITRNDQERSIYIQNGDIIFAASKYEDDGLGETLLKSGRITMKQFDLASAEVRKSKKRFGAVLVETGILDPKELFGFVTGQVRNIILSLFTWLDADYRFEEGDLPVHEVITIKISTANIILDGLKRINDIAILRKFLPAGNAVFEMTDDPLILFQDMNLSDKEQDVLALVDGHRMEGEIFEESPLPPFDTMKLIYFFVSIGLIEICGAEKSGAVDKESAIGAAATQAREKEIPPGEITGELAREVREEKQATFQEALHEHSISRESEGGEDSRGVRKFIEAAFLALEKQDYYEVLGLTREATSGQIKKAYIKLAKDFHPDRHYQAGLEGMTEKLEAIFGRVTEAYNTLLADHKRREYDAGLVKKKMDSVRGKGQPGKTGPEEEARKGEAAYKQGEIKAAVFHFEAAVKASPDTGRFHARLGKLLARLKGRGRDAEKHYKRAIELEPANFQYSIELARIYKQNGMVKLARKQYEAVLVWDPENSAVQAEIAGLEG